MAFVTQIVSATALVSVLATFPGFFASWFTSEQTVIDIVTRMMPIFVCGWGIFGIQMGAQCALVGMGQAKQSVFLAIFRKIILLVPLALLLPHWIGVNGIFIAEPISRRHLRHRGRLPVLCHLPQDSARIWSRLLIQWMCRLMRCETRDG